MAVSHSAKLDAATLDDMHITKHIVVRSGVATPFVDVAEHVVEAPRIRVLLADGMCLPV